MAGVEIAALASTLLYRYVNVPQRALASHTQAAWVDPCICCVMCIDIYYLSMYTAIYMRTSRKGLQWPGAGLSGEQRYDAARWRFSDPRDERFFMQPGNILYSCSVFESQCANDICTYTCVYIYIYNAKIVFTFI